MEKIRVNMTPCEEVKTIHASQDDNATRKWAFDLYDENGKIDSSDIKEQMIFDSKVGGTEQILPENTSVPTTSPIIADVQYPDSLRSEQTFLYRESPTSEDGQAKITHIKGNTVVFNQQIQNGNFVGTSNWTSFGTNVTTLTANNNELTFTNVSATAGYMNSLRQTFDYSRVQGHKLYYCATILSSVADEIRITLTKNMFVQETASTSYKKYEGIFNYQTPLTPAENYFEINPRSTISGSYIKVKNVILIDLTQMGLDYITSVDQFTSLYPLPYYAYTTGKLLPFLGEELKTVGFNQWDEEWENGSIDTTTGANVASNASIRSKNYIRVIPSGTYYIKLPTTVVVSARIMFYDGNKNYLTYLNWIRNTTFVIPDDAVYLRLRISDTYGSGAYHNDICLNISDTQKNGVYESYTSYTNNLPTLDFFPTGMKSAGSVYDEITESKAITRIKSINFSDYTWNYNGDYNVWYSIEQPPIDTQNNMCFLNALIPYAVCQLNNSVLGSRVNQTYNIWVRNGSDTVSPSGLAYYASTTPTEESITTASLVTEKGEAPLYYDDELIADCNETISSESGIFDAKIKLMNDETIYSQKIQLHIERKPQ